MSSPLLRLSRLVLVAAMFVAIGGHWVVLQTVAWGGMIVDYSRESGFAVAVEKTFDGQHPCDMCKTIAKTRQTEKKREALLRVVKTIDAVCETVTPWVPPVVASWEQRLVNSAPVWRGEAPSVPPPRAA